MFEIRNGKKVRTSSILHIVMFGFFLACDDVVYKWLFEKQTYFDFPR